LAITIIVCCVAYLADLVTKSTGIQGAFIDATIAVIIQLVADFIRWFDLPVTHKKAVDALQDTQSTNTR
jgi:hypothetical protein